MYIWQYATLEIACKIVMLFFCGLCALIHHGNGVIFPSNYESSFFHLYPFRTNPWARSQSQDGPCSHITSWWHHDLETFSSLLALGKRNPLISGGFPSQWTKITWKFFMCACTNGWTNNGVHSHCNTYIASAPIGPLTRYVKLRVTHAPGMPGTFSPLPTSKETVS